MSQRHLLSFKLEKVNKPDSTPASSASRRENGMSQQSLLCAYPGDLELRDSLALLHTNSWGLLPRTT